VTRLRDGRSGVPIPAAAKHFCLTQNFQTGSGAHASLLFNGYRGKTAGASIHRSLQTSAEVHEYSRTSTPHTPSRRKEGQFCVQLLGKYWPYVVRILGNTRRRLRAQCKIVSALQQLACTVTSVLCGRRVQISGTRSRDLLNVVRWSRIFAGPRCGSCSCHLTGA
jgi:hypothetical protein